jgi:hypothetical protein
MGIKLTRIVDSQHHQRARMAFFRNQRDSRSTELFGHLDHPVIDQIASGNAIDL